MLHQKKWVLIAIISLFSILGSNGLYAEVSSIKTKNTMSGSLGDSVDKIVQIISYVDTRLLSDENVKRIEESGNYEAIAILHRSLNDRELIDAQINQGRFDEAYIAMRAIGNRIAHSIKLSWANERVLKEEMNRIESERIISDAYFNRVKQMGIFGEDASEQAIVLYRNAQEIRLGAQSLMDRKDYKTAAMAFKHSTKLLKKAFMYARKNDSSKMASET